MRVGLVIHGGRDAALRAAADLVEWCRDRGITTRVLEGPTVKADETAGEEAFAEDLDLVISVGGDGTLLRAAFMGNRADVPVLGVKVGRLGFLTEVEPGEAPALLDRWMAGGAHIDERMALEAVAEGIAGEPQWALNEVIVEKRARHRVVRLATTVNEDHVTTFSADGVIVATPTGSTAYSFSAGGPIVSPSVPCIVVTPVAAHMVFDRSLVLHALEHVTLEVLSEEPGLLSADGRAALELPVGSRVRIAAAPRPSRFVRREDAPPFHEVVRRKFDLPGQQEVGP